MLDSMSRPRGLQPRRSCHATTGRRLPLAQGLFMLAWVRSCSVTAGILTASGTELIADNVKQRVDGSHHLDYMPGHNVLFCACAKCGMTSFYNYLFEQEFGHPWSYTGRPFVHQTASYRWEKTVEAIRSPERQQELLRTSFSFALVRDPKERLISAWKSKVACNHAKTGVDFGDRAVIVPELRRLQGRDANITCLSLEDFLSALRTIHDNGDAGKLNIHFLPQNLGCFQNSKPSLWTKVSTIKDTEAFQSLAFAMGNHENLSHRAPPAAHRSNMPELKITTKAARLLEEVTAKEYEVLGDYFPKKRATVAPTAPVVPPPAFVDREQPAVQKTVPAEAPAVLSPASVDREQPAVLKMAPAEAHLDYLPGQNVVVCSCAKCGSTSLYRFLFMAEFGHEWPYIGRPFLQETTSTRWDNRVIHLPTVASQTEVMEKAFSYALVRDPRERLISAWKSKVACDDEHTGVNAEDRATIVPDLLRLAGWKPVDSCLSFDKFMTALHQVHEKGRAMYLNNHFRPQDTWCFQKFPVDSWGAVTNIKADHPFQTLAERFSDSGNSSVAVDIRPGHRSSTKEIHPSEKAKLLLDLVTANEYKVLTPYLGQAQARPSERGAGEDVQDAQKDRGLEAAEPDRFKATSPTADYFRIPAATADFGGESKRILPVADAGHQQAANLSYAVSFNIGTEDGEQKGQGGVQSKPFHFHVKYLWNHNLVVCACKACGASQIYSYIYEHEIGHRWEYTNKPFVIQTTTPRWKNRWENLYKPQAMEQVMKKAHSLVWVLDPTDRLLSAWEKKVACDRAQTDVDKRERAWIVPELRRLQARSTANITCLSFPDFVRALHTIHKEGKANMLNPSFLPQSQECLQKFPASRWTQVINARRPDSMAPLVDALGGGQNCTQHFDDLQLRSTTALRARLKKMPAQVKQLLAEITRPEYEALGDFIKQA